MSKDAEGNVSYNLHLGEEHEHQYVIPVEWGYFSYKVKEPVTKLDRYPTSLLSDDWERTPDRPDRAMGKKVSKLRCGCGSEIDR